MRFDVVSLFPEWVKSITDYGVIHGACQRGLVEIHSWNPRDFTSDRHRTVDDRPYGGGPGMVMKYTPLHQCILAAQQLNTGPVIYLSPQGKKIEQAKLKNALAFPGLILVAGRYEGVDQRYLDCHVDDEWSIGDYVLTGGELAAMVVIDAMSRLIPGVLGHQESAEQDSFTTGLLDYPHYTRPEEVDGLRVPEVLLSGDHQAIADWRRQQALGLTWQKRPELLDKIELTEKDRGLLEAYQRKHHKSSNR